MNIFEKYSFEQQWIVDLCKPRFENHVDLFALSFD